MVTNQVMAGTVGCDQQQVKSDFWGVGTEKNLKGEAKESLSSIGKWDWDVQSKPGFQTQDIPNLTQVTRSTTAYQK